MRMLLGSNRNKKQRNILYVSYQFPYDSWGCLSHSVLYIAIHPELNHKTRHKNIVCYISSSKIFFKIVILHAMNTISFFLSPSLSLTLPPILVPLYPLHMNNVCTENIVSLSD